MCSVTVELGNTGKIVKKQLGVYQSIIHRVFCPMQRGLLTIVLPDGIKLRYGKESDTEVQAEIRVLRNDFFRKCVFYGDVGFGESFVDGDWETDDITAVICWMILNVENHPTLMGDKTKRRPVNFLKLFNNIYHRFRANTVKGSQKNIEEHYDLSNDFFQLFLDPTMNYSSGYFRNSQQSLEDAQIAKCDELCRKLRLKPADHLLEIGSGWGGFSVYAARNYGCRVTTITISKEQYAYVRQRITAEGLGDRIDVQLRDYRHMEGKFDKIVSIEMIEAVGHDFFQTYFAQIHRLLKRDGLLALQMIVSPDHRYESFRRNVDWIQKHIFPGSLLPSMKVVTQSINKTGDLCLFDYEDITCSYVKTLALWREGFNQQLTKLSSLGFDGAFVRKWNYYFSYCEAAFKMRNISVVQTVYSRPNNQQLRCP